MILCTRSEIFLSTVTVDVVTLNDLEVMSRRENIY